MLYELRILRSLHTHKPSTKPGTDYKAITEKINPDVVDNESWIGAKNLTPPFEYLDKVRYF